jgi:hypothetical protein
MLLIRRGGFTAGVVSLLLCGAAPQQQLADNGKPYLTIPASPPDGFNYPYIIFAPPQAAVHCFPYLMVEPNNAPGVSPDDAALTEARAGAVRVATHFSLGNEMAQRFGAPLLVPVFPRPPFGADSDIDAFSLSRAALFATGRLRRPDLQLAAMIADARRRLAAAGRRLEKKVAITGFSGSALFANRFTLLHPDLVLAAAYGRLNSFITLPVAAWQGHDLEYPVGLADYRAIAGHVFDEAAYAAIPQIAFQGENDTNDAVPMDDEYTMSERDLIWRLFGKSMYPQRWHAIEAVYGSVRTAVQFRIYTDIGHGFDLRALADVFALFSRAAGCESGKKGDARFGTRYSTP